MCLLCEALERLQEPKKLVYPPLVDATGFPTLAEGLHYTDRHRNATLAMCCICGPIADHTDTMPMYATLGAHERDTGHRCLYVMSEAD